MPCVLAVPPPKSPMSLNVWAFAARGQVMAANAARRSTPVLDFIFK